jgi:predicted lipoprotein with Yx(FWY)xxD motif
MRFVTGLAATLLAVAATGSLAAEPAMQGESSLGKVYTDSKGMTLYTFDKDEPGKSNCYDQCAVNWPIFEAPADAMAEGEWTIVERTDGTRQWAYEGKPLYFWKDDKAPGDVTGEGKGDNTWHVAKVD